MQWLLLIYFILLLLLTILDITIYNRLEKRVKKLEKITNRLEKFDKIQDKHIYSLAKDIDMIDEELDKHIPRID